MIANSKDIKNIKKLLQPTQRAEWAGYKSGNTLFKQRQFERQWKKVTNPWSTGIRW